MAAIPSILAQTIIHTGKYVNISFDTTVVSPLETVVTILQIAYGQNGEKKQKSKKAKKNKNKKNCRKNKKNCRSRNFGYRNNMEMNRKKWPQNAKTQFSLLRPLDLQFIWANNEIAILQRLRILRIPSRVAIHVYYLLARVRSRVLKYVLSIDTRVRTRRLEDVHVFSRTIHTSVHVMCTFGPASLPLVG